MPPRRRREALLQEICGDILPTATCSRLANADYLAPAVLRRATGVFKRVCKQLPEIDPARTLETLIDNTLTVQGHRPLPKGSEGVPTGGYNLRYLRTDSDPAQISSGLRKVGSGRLCLYGPPGTGKTAFGHWLAHHLDIPLHIHRASDIISPWLGMTEQKLAEIFREAERDRALLLLDEVDGFLRDRRQARHSWEVTAVNEMLTQMESFNGIFIASTNLFGDLDQAALRRFDLKIHFDYLGPEQAWPLFRQHCHSLGLNTPAGKLKNELAALKLITPGDFTAIARRHRLSPLTGPTDLLAALTAECELKEDGRKQAIGFV